MLPILIAKALLSYLVITGSSYNAFPVHKNKVIVQLDCIMSAMPRVIRTIGPT